MGIGGQVGELAGGVIGEVDAMKNDAQIQYLLNRMKQRYEELPNKERIGNVDVRRSELGDVSEDPRYKSAEDEALRRLMQYSQGGMSDADRLALEQAKREGLDYERGVRGRNDSLAARRGQASSGAQHAADVAAEQGGIDRAYMGDLSTAATAADRGLAATNAAGGYASKLGSRDLDQKNLTATANDRISAFNAMRGDKANYYNAGLDQENALAKAGGLDKEAMLELMQNKEWADSTRKRWRGYGKQAGSLFDSMGAMSGGGGEGGGGGMGGMDFGSFGGGGGG